MATTAVLEPGEVDQLILDTIRHIHKSKKRAFSDLVCKTIKRGSRPR